MRTLERALFTGAVLGVMLCATGASAAPVVKVRARTKVHIEAVKRVEQGVEVTGTAVDAYSGVGIGQIAVVVHINDGERMVYTDERGWFSAVFPIEDGRHDVAVELAADEYFEGDTAEMSQVDVTKQSLELRISARDVSYSKRTIEVAVQAGNEYGGAAIEAELWAGPSGGDLVRVSDVRTDREGHATIDLERERLGVPGRKQLEVRFLGNRVFNPARARSDFLFATATETSLSLDPTGIAYEGELTATGRVVDDLGKPVVDGAVSLVVGTRRVAAALTDDSGRFRMEADGDEIGTGRFNVQAAFEPIEPWYQASRSTPAQIDVAQPQPVPVTYTLAAFGATALAMAAFLGLRSKPWEAWLARLRRRPQDSAGQAGNAAAGAPAIRHGLQLARPGLVSTLRRPHDFDLSGTVRDAVRSRPIPDSIITLSHPTAGKRSEKTGQDGRFIFTALEPGEWSATGVAHGYVTERFSVTVPHRGELRDVHIDLLPVRERVFALYRDVAEPLLPGAEMWGIWTPRQIFDFVRKERPASALAELTDFVEETYFSQRVPGEAILDDARVLLQRTWAETVAERGPPT